MTPAARSPVTWSPVAAPVGDEDVGEMGRPDPREGDPAQLGGVGHQAAGARDGGALEAYVVEVEVGQAVLRVGTADRQDEGVEPEVFEDPFSQPAPESLLARAHVAAGRDQPDARLVAEFGGGADARLLLRAQSRTHREGRP
ncbi:MAG TPA: hypothetical protein VGP31_10670 [Planosporangium sp.]|nr:hypothetical protein [Planosporangium sp.]